MITLATPFWLSAQHTRYQLIDLGTLGGPMSVVGAFTRSVNNRGTVTASADTSTPDPYAPNCSVVNPYFEDCLVQHAFLWQKGVLTDLGALPGINSSVGNWISANGLIVG